MKIRFLAVAAMIACTLPAAFLDARGDSPPPGAGPASIEEAERLYARVREGMARIATWEEARGRFEADDLLAVDTELLDSRISVYTDLAALGAAIAELEARGVPTADLRGRVEPLMTEAPGDIRQLANESLANASRLRAERAVAEPSRVIELEYRIAREYDQVNQLFHVFVTHLAAMERLGLDVTGLRDWISEMASLRAEILARRVEITLERQKLLKLRSGAAAADPLLAQEQVAVETRLEGDLNSLSSAAKALEDLGLEAKPYQELIVMTRGQITDISEAEAIPSLLLKTVEAARSWISRNGFSLAVRAAAVLLILGIAWLASIVAQRVIQRALRSSRFPVSKLLESMLMKLTRRVILLVGALMALTQFDVHLAPLLAGLGVAGFIVGFALQDVLSNFASGVMILIYRPFDVGDVIEVGGVTGKVDRMTLVSTCVLTLDHQLLIIPNNKIWGDIIRNVTAQTMRRVDMTFGISYTDDISKAEKLLETIVREHPRVLAEPAPVIKVHALGESSVDLIVRPWVRTEDYWDVYWDLTRTVKVRFDENGISIPFPQREIHVRQDAPAAARA